LVATADTPAGAATPAQHKTTGDALSTRGHGRLAPAALALLAYLVLTLAFTYPLAVEFARAIPGDAFDGWQNLWNLWWVKIALVDRHTHPYFTDLLYAPTGVSLLFHTLNPFNGATSLPIQLAWGLLPAYNSVVLFSFTLGGLGACLLARRVLGRRAGWLPAFGTGLIFTFSPFHIAHLLGHLQVISLEWIPFYALYLTRIVQGHRAQEPKDGPAETRGEGRFAHRARRQFRHDVLMAALFLVLVALCDLYYVLYCLILTFVVLAWSGWRVLRSQALRADGGALTWQLSSVGAAWAIFGLALSPVLAPMAREATQMRFMVPEAGQSRVLSADLLAFVTPQEFHPIWGRAAQKLASGFAATVSEHQVFAGFVVIALVILGLWASGSRGRRPSGSVSSPWPWVLVAFFVLSLGPALHVGGRTALLPGGGEVALPYAWLVRVVPFMDITRSVSRMDAMVMLAAGVLAGAGLKWLLQHGAAGRALAGAAMALTLFEFFPAPYPMTAPDTPQWYQRLATDPRDGAVLNLPLDWDRPGYLLYQTVHRKPLTSAYISRDDPRTLVDRVPVLQAFRHLGPDIIDLDLALQGQQVLNDLGVRWVVLDRYKMPGGLEREYIEATARAVFSGAQPDYEDDRLTVYEVRNGEPLAPYMMLGDGWNALDERTRARRFVGSAGLIIESPAAGVATLRVRTAPGSGPLRLPARDGVYRLPLELHKGSNTVMLSAEDVAKPVIITEMALEGS